MKIAVLFGGRSYERQVSIRSGERVEAALHELGHDAVPIDVDAQSTRKLVDAQVDCAFIALHGAGGEDGSIQELLESLQIPYTGSSPEASHIANDKALTKRMCQRLNIATPPFVSLTAAALQEYGAADALGDIVQSLEFPVVVKPASGGSALGIRFVDDASQLPRALFAALSYDKRVVVERYIHGRELSIGILGSGESTTALPAVRIAPKHADYYDFESRYTHGECEFTCPPTDLSNDELDEAIQLALDSYRCIGMSGFGRVDMIVDDAGTCWLLELNSIPGMTETSLLPLASEASGISFPQLVQRLVDDAMTHHTNALNVSARA